MIVETSDNLRNLQRINASQVVLFNRFNEPFLIVTESIEGAYSWVSASDRIKFAQALREAGVLAIPPQVERLQQQ